MLEGRGALLVVREKGGAILVVREKGRLSWLSERRRGDSLSCQRGEGGLPLLATPQSRDTAAGDFPVGPALGQG